MGLLDGMTQATMTTSSAPSRSTASTHVPVSACIIAMNEVDRIRRCIESVSWCDEVVVLDSGSTDGTQALCRELGARVIETDWPGWVKQKQRAAEAATHDWIFSLDADERVDDELRDALLALRATCLADDGTTGLADGGTKPLAFAVTRKVFFLGGWIKHGGWYPEWRTRLFHRGHAAWGGIDPHDRVETACTVKRVRDGNLEHYTWRSMEDYLDKTNRFSTVAANEKYKRGKRARWWDICLRPAFRFFRMYVLRAGFLDGGRGLVLAILDSYGVFLKYAKLWNLRQHNAQHPAANATP